MAEPDTYKTLAGKSEGIYKEKGSKFIAYAYPVSTEEEIKKLVQDLKKEYYDARHHCFAWKLGLDDNHYRINDDGEPSGTAGKPIFGQILSHELTNVLVVVIRYFGGTKLGTSGLILAYKSATADAISHVEIVDRTVNDTYLIEFDYGVMNDVMRVVKEEAPKVLNQSFNLRCEMEVSTRKTNVDSLIGRLNTLESVKTTYLRTC